MPGGHNAGRAMRGGLPALVCAVSWLGALCALGGCMVGPSFKRPEVVVPDNWRELGGAQIAAQSAVDSQWWKSFNDPALDRLIELASRQNLPLQIAGLRIVEARAQWAVATGRQLPQLQALSARAEAQGLTKRLAEVSLLDRDFLAYQLGFDAAWELDFWGKYRNAVDAESANAIASVADYYSTLVSLSAEVARTYVLIRTYDLLIQQAEENVRLQEESLRIARARFESGATSELDVTQAAALLDSTRASIPRLQLSLVQARNALSTLLGQPTGTVDALLEGPRTIPSVPVTVAVGLPAEMLRRRPDIRRAEALAAAQCSRVGVAKADLFPSFALFGSVGLQATNSGPFSHNLFSPDSFVYTVGPRIYWPFFNYGRLENSVRVQDARFQQALVGYRDTVLRALQEVEDSLAGFANAQQAAVFEQRSLEAARRSVEISLVQYREGAVDFQRVLDAQRSLVQQQNNLSQTTSSVATSLIALYKALGGGWEVHQGEPVVSEQTGKEMSERTNWGDALSQPRPTESTKKPSGENR